MDDPWIIFLEEFRDRAEILPEQQPVDQEELAEALQETQEATLDRLQHQLDLRLAEARRLARGFSRVAEAWVREDRPPDWDELEERLEFFQAEWDAEMGTSPA
jgi:hypothetical protein